MSRDCYVLLLTMLRVCLQFVIVVFPDHTYLLFLLQTDDEQTVNHQIAVFRAYRPKLLNLTHETPMSGHFGVKKIYIKDL